MNPDAILFYALAALTSVCAVAVVVSQNIVRAAAWLLFALAGTAGIFFLLNAEFLGATQLLVYVGGTLVLVVFGVMLTAQGPFIHMRIGAAEWAIATAVGLLLYAVLAVSLVQINMGQAMPGDMSNSENIGLALLGVREATPYAHITGVPAGNKLADRPTDRNFMSYLLPFEIVSVHLLVVLIGAAYLARAKRRRGEPS
jgi:NADH-quinone oxidoreductase subunit J